jgi:hypothetical protein
MKIDLSKVKITTIDGTKEEKATMYKTVANLIYMKCRNLDLVRIAMDMHEGKPTELTDSMFKEIRGLVKDENNGIYSFARKTVLDEMDKQKEKADKGK